MRAYIVFIILIFVNINHLFADEILPANIKDFFEQYRHARSLAVAATGKKITDGIREKYFHYMFYALGNDDNKNIYILADEYEITSIKFESKVTMEYRDKMYKLLKTTKEDNYLLEVTEKIISLIKYSPPNGAVPPNRRPGGSYKSHYSIYVTEDGPKIESESPLSIYWVLEKDVPVLLNRLNATGNDAGVRVYAK